jgi:hypothetical protein
MPRRQMYKCRRGRVFSNRTLASSTRAPQGLAALGTFRGHRSERRAAYLLHRSRLMPWNFRRARSCRSCRYISGAGALGIAPERSSNPRPS